MAKFDIHCYACDGEWERELPDAKHNLGYCPRCGGEDLRVIWRTMPTTPKKPQDEHDLKRNIPVEPLVFGPPKKRFTKDVKKH